MAPCLGQTISFAAAALEDLIPCSIENRSIRLRNTCNVDSFKKDLFVECLDFNILSIVIVIVLLLFTLSINTIFGA